MCACVMIVYTLTLAVSSREEKYNCCFAASLQHMRQLYVATVRRQAEKQLTSAVQCRKCFESGHYKKIHLARSVCVRCAQHSQYNLIERVCSCVRVCVHVSVNTHTYGVALFRCRLVSRSACCRPQQFHSVLCRRRSRNHHHLCGFFVLCATTHSNS